MRFRLLGPVEVLDGDEWVHLGGARTPALMSALLLRANTTVDPQWLMRVVWPGARPASAEANLRQYVARVREVLRRHGLDDVARLRCAAPGYRFETGRDQVDLTAFADLSATGRQALATRDFGAARDCLARAVGLWQGELCQGLPPSQDLMIEQAYWSEQRLLAAESLLTARLRLGEHGEAAAELHRLTAEYPLREELRGMLMVSLYRCHRRGDALAVFGDARSALVTELGIEPGPYLQRLHQAILADDPRLVSQSRPADGTRPAATDNLLG